LLKYRSRIGALKLFSQFEVVAKRLIVLLIALLCLLTLTLLVKLLH